LRITSFSSFKFLILHLKVGSSLDTGLLYKKMELYPPEHVHTEDSTVGTDEKRCFIGTIDYPDWQGLHE